MLDMREHAKESLYSTSLAELQSSALVICLEGVVVDEAELSHLLGTGQREIREPSFPQMGVGLSSLFSCGDCVQVISGDLLHMCDPTGRGLSLNDVEAEDPTGEP